MEVGSEKQRSGFVDVQTSSHQAHFTRGKVIARPITTSVTDTTQSNLEHENNAEHQRFAIETER